MNTNEKRLCRLAAAGFFLLSLPVLALSFYNVPCADDYTFGRRMYAWVAEHGYGIFGMLRCAFENMIDYYFNWQGRYSESFLASFMPDIFGAYWLWTIWIWLFLGGSVLFLFVTLFRRLAGREYTWMGIGTGAAVCAALLQKMPSPVEAFYWFDGSMAYMLHHGFYLFMCGLVVNYLFEEDKKKSARYLAGACVLTVLAAGGNNVTSFMSILTYVVFWGIVLLIKRKRWLILPFTLSVVGFMVSYLSPGTRIRGGDEYSPILLTIKNCFVWTIKQYLFRWTTVSVLVLLVFLTPFLLKAADRIRERFEFRFPVPLLLAIGDVCFLSAMSSPSFYILGEPGPGRMRNIIYVNFLLILVLSYAYVLGWLSERFGEKLRLSSVKTLYERIPWWESACAVVLVLGLLCVKGSVYGGVSLEAVKELASGEAARYHEQAMERKEAYLDPELTDVEVEPYEYKPYLLFFDDITDDPGNWKNQGVSGYYGKDSVRLNRYDPEVDYD